MGVVVTSDKIDQEIEADQMALYYFKDSGWLPILVAPMMQYFHLLDNKNVSEELIFTHPSGLERVSSMCNTSLMNLKPTYNKMQQFGPILISYEDMVGKVEQVYFNVCEELIEEMDQDYDTYLLLAEIGNVSAQIKMGIMHFRGVDGWKLDQDEGFMWLKRAAQKSDFASLLLGMLYESSGSFDLALQQYEENQENYFAGILYMYLKRWEVLEKTGFEQLMLTHMKVVYEKCMNECINLPDFTVESCKYYYCNVTPRNLFYGLMKFRISNKL